MPCSWWSTGTRSICYASALGDAARGVQFADMHQIGRNPARNIPAWRDFVDRNVAAGRGVRGIGEPIWAGRSPRS